MLGTFGGALEARHIDASNSKLVAEVTGEVKAEDGVLVIRRIHVVMQLVASEDSRKRAYRGPYAYALSSLIGPCTTRSNSHPLRPGLFGLLTWAYHMEVRQSSSRSLAERGDNGYPADGHN